MSFKGMLQRCWSHDYCAPSFYMVTVVTEPRRECLSQLITGAGAAPDTEPGAAPDTEPEAAPATAPRGAQFSLNLSPIGEIVQDVWKRTSTVYKGVEACECVVMPDHFHGILWVKERQPRPVGHIIKAFKRVSKDECSSKGLLLPPNPGSVSGAAPGSVSGAAQGSVSGAAPAPELWQEGYQDSILLRKGQLKAMANYIAENPHRLAAKRANPELFTVTKQHLLAPNRTCTMIGNHFLLKHPLKQQIQISRSISQNEMDNKKKEFLYAANHGAVLVSPCISPGEKEIARTIMNAGKLLIVILTNGLSPFYKPPGKYFKACANGHLLMIAPLPGTQHKQTITREQCLALNEWAEFIANIGTNID